MYEGYTLDFVSPWLYGIAKKMIARGLRAMINPFTGNLVINHHGKVFELKAIAGVLGVDLVFLIVSPTEYAVWKIEDEGVTLTPSDFSINKFCLQTTVGEIAFHPSTLKSNSNENEHGYLIEDLSGLTISNWPTRRYGYYDNSAQYFNLFGLIRNYVPSGWTIGSKEIFSGVAYLGSDEWASSRNNWQVVEDGVVYKNLKAKKNVPSDTVEILYTDEEGEKVGYSEPWHEGVMAVLNKEQFVGIDYDNPYTVPGFDIVYYPYNTCFYGDSSTYGLINGVASELSGTISDFKFGSVVIEPNVSSGLGFVTFREQSVTGAISRRCCNDDPTDEYLTGHNFAWAIDTSLSSALRIMDYDNRDNKDETFIMFYSRRYTGRLVNNITAFTGASQVLLGDNGCLKGTPFLRREGKNLLFMLAYRLKGGALKKEFITSISSGQDPWGTHFEYYTTSADCSSPNTGTTSNLQNDSIPAGPIVTSGKRIKRVSCKATKQYLLYSYILQEYSGPTATTVPAQSEYHGVDDNDADWTFIKRVLGVIDIETGKRTEYTVNDTLLGNLYKDTFDEEKASAVGLHRR